MAEFLIVDVGAESIKVGGTLTVIGVSASADDARERVQKDLQRRSAYIAILQVGSFHRVRNVITLDDLTSPIVTVAEPSKPGGK